MTDEAEVEAHNLAVSVGDSPDYTCAELEGEILALVRSEVERAVKARDADHCKELYALHQPRDGGPDRQATRDPLPRICLRGVCVKDWRHAMTRPSESTRLAVAGIACMALGMLSYGRVGALCALAYIFAGHFVTESGRASRRGGTR